MTAADTLARLLSVEGMEPPNLTPLLTDEPKLPIYMTKLCIEAWGQGAHHDPVIAQLKAAGEALERYCLLTPADDSSVQGRYGETDGQVDPADFYCYSRAQTDDYDGVIEELRYTSFYWTTALDAASGASVLVPREFVYLDAASFETRQIRRESVSSGAALGTAGTQDAFRRALFELIERDAFMAVWLRGEALERLGGYSGATAELIDLLNRYRLDCRLFRIPSDYGVPVVLALTLDRSGIGPAVTSGLSASETVSAAAEAALLESISYRRQVRLKQMSGEFPEVHDAAEIVSAVTRIAYWADPARLAELPAWIASPATVNMRALDSSPCTARGALDALTSRGCRVLRVDITAPAAKTMGFEAVRVIVPELHPLYLSEAARALYSFHLGALLPAAIPHPLA